MEVNTSSAIVEWLVKSVITKEVELMDKLIATIIKTAVLHHYLPYNQNDETEVLNSRFCDQIDVVVNILHNMIIRDMKNLGFESLEEYKTLVYQYPSFWISTTLKLIQISPNRDLIEEAIFQ